MGEDIFLEKKKIAKKRKGKIEINEELCKGCKYCIMSCPTGAITMGDKLNSMGYFYACLTHPDKCTGCAICGMMCPDIAIEVWREE